MGRKGHRAKTKTVLKLVKQWEQLGSMQNWKFEIFGNKNPPTVSLLKYCTSLEIMLPSKLILYSLD